LRAFVGGHGRLGIITKVVFRVAVRTEFDREVVFEFDGLEAALACARRIVQRSVRPAAARIVESDGRFRLAMQIHSASEELTLATDAIVASAASAESGRRSAVESALAEAGRFDRVVEVAQRWTRAAETHRALLDAGALEVWVDFLTPEGVTLVARLEHNDHRRGVVEAAIAAGGRIVAGLRSASPLDLESYARDTGESWPQTLPAGEVRPGPYDDVLARLSDDLDPRGVFRERDVPSGSES